MKSRQLYRIGNQRTRRKCFPPAEAHIVTHLSTKLIALRIVRAPSFQLCHTTGLGHIHPGFHPKNKGRFPVPRKSRKLGRRSVPQGEVTTERSDDVAKELGPSSASNVVVEQVWPSIAVRCRGTRSRAICICVYGRLIGEGPGPANNEYGPVAELLPSPRCPAGGRGN